MALLKKMVDAYGSKGAIECPFTSEPPSERPVVEIPKELHDLVRLYYERKEHAKSLMKTTAPNDEGYWYKSNNLAEAIKYLLDDELREAARLSFRCNFEFHAGFRASYGSP